VLALVILMFSVGGRLLWNEGIHAAIVALSLLDRRWSIVVRRWQTWPANLAGPAFAARANDLG
jgi:hypothetical protein